MPTTNRPFNWAEDDSPWATDDPTEHSGFVRSFAGLAVFATLLNLVLILAAIAGIALAVKWVLS